MTVNPGSVKFEISLSKIFPKKKKATGKLPESLTSWRNISRDSNFRWTTFSTARDIDLGTGDVPLRCTSNVQCGLFDTNEIFTGRCVGRDGSCQLTLVHIGEGEGVEGSPPLGDLYTKNKITVSMRVSLRFFKIKD